MKRNSYSSEKNWNLKDTAALVVLIIVLMVMIFNYVIIDIVNEQTYTVKVTDTYVKNQKSDSLYLVSTELVDFENEVRVFCNRDNWWKHKVASSDLQAKLKVGHTYKFKTVGYRLPLFSTYENIIEVKELSTPAESQTN